MDPNLRGAIDDVHQRIIECAHAVISRVVRQQGVDSGAADEVMLYAGQLFRLLPDASKPIWLVKLVSQFQGKTLASNVGGNLAGEFVAFLISNMYNIESPLLAPDEVLLNFDAAFDQAREAAGIPAAFDHLVARLETIIAADLIDSRVVQQALERLMTLLNRNKHGSLTSILVSMHYGRFAIKAFGGALAANKYLKPMVDAFKEEFSIAEGKVRTAEDSLRTQAIRRLVNEERLMAYIEESKGDSKVIAGYLGLMESRPRRGE